MAAAAAGAFAVAEPAPTIGGVAIVESRRKLTKSLWFISSVRNSFAPLVSVTSKSTFLAEMFI